MTYLNITSRNFNNHSDESHGVRYIWATYYMSVLTLTLLGDSVILIASIKFGAIKINPYLVAIIQHLAVCDLMTTVFNHFTTAVAFLANKWVLGYHYCYISALMAYYTVGTAPMLTCLMITSKLIMVKRQNSNLARYMTSGMAHMLCSGIWASSFLIPSLVLALTVGYDSIYFDRSIGLCEFEVSTRSWHILGISFLVVYFFLPFTVITASAALLIKHLLSAHRIARLVGRSKRWQGIVTVFITAIIFMATSAPIAAYIIVKISGTNNATNFSEFYRICYAFQSLNVVCNFFIYSFSVTSFRQFLCSKVSIVNKQGEKNQIISLINDTGV